LVSDELPTSKPSTTSTSSTTKQSPVALEQNYRQHSVQALLLLAELAATLLDVVYRSEEKERVVPFLSQHILSNVFPYLRNHRLVLNQ
jgi:hypothetical protein